MSERKPDVPPEEQTLEVRRGPHPRTVKTIDGNVLQVPDDWAVLAPGDATLTKRVKKAGPSWTVKYKRGRYWRSAGVWARAETIERLRAERQAEREDPAYKRRLAKSRARREKKHREYVAEFERACVEFLDFDPAHSELAETLATVVAEHATPVGSGTVARTSRLELEKKVELAVIAWMRHNTTDYDHMRIPRKKGARREVRRKLARQSHALLERYRSGDAPEAECPLRRALEELDRSEEEPERTRPIRWGGAGKRHREE